MERDLAARVDRLLSGNTEGFDALQKLTQAVMDSREIEDAQRNEILEHLRFVVSQAALPPEQRNVSIGKSVLAGIERLLGSAADLATVWTTVQPHLATLFESLPR